MCLKSCEKSHLFCKKSRIYCEERCVVCEQNRTNWEMRVISCGKRRVYCGKGPILCEKSPMWCETCVQSCEKSPMFIVKRALCHVCHVKRASWLAKSALNHAKRALYCGEKSFMFWWREPYTGWRRFIGSPKLQIIFHKRATTDRSLLRKMTYKDKGSYESSPPCIVRMFYENKPVYSREKNPPSFHLI